MPRGDPVQKLTERVVIRLEVRHMAALKELMRPRRIRSPGQFARMLVEEAVERLEKRGRP